MPFQQMRGGLLDGEGNPAKVPAINGHLWVPIDDENVFVYNWIYGARRDADHDRVLLAAEKNTGRHPEDYIPGTYWLKRNKSNDYMIDREVQRTRTFTGIGGANTQDFALHSALGGGYIEPRWLEALGSSEVAIQSFRKLLLEATDDVEAGRPMRGADPATHSQMRGADAILPRGVPWRDVSKEMVKTRW